MPWKRARALPPPDNTLFEACFRIQREASEAAGRYVPLIVENVVGAQKWVGRARWHYGSYYLWGDVPALMPITKSLKVSGLNWSNYGKSGYRAEAFNTTAEVRMREDVKFGGGWWHDSTNNLIRKAGSHSPARKAASAMIAKIPEPLARHIARCFK